MNISLLDGGTYTCILTRDTAEEVSEEHVKVTVFERVEDTEIRHRVISRTEDTSEEDFYVKYLKYQVTVNNSYKHQFSHYILSYCLLLTSLRFIVK